MSRTKRKPLEFFKFFWRDFDRDTQHLNRAQRSGYMSIICAYYDNQGPLHENAVHKASGATAEEWAIERDLMAPFFVISRDGMWRHRRIESELKTVRTTSKKRAAAGRTGGAKKANAKQLLSNSLTTKDVKGIQASPCSLFQKKRLSKKEHELLAARERVWTLEHECKAIADTVGEPS